MGQKQLLVAVTLGALALGVSSAKAADIEPVAEPAGWRRGELEKLPIEDESVDVALLSQALHHASDPARAVAEAARITVPGGRVLILDLRQHQEEWVRAKLGDRSLGFREDQLKQLLLASGLEHAKTGVGSSRMGDPFAVLIASATKPAKRRAVQTPRRKKR